MTGKRELQLAYVALELRDHGLNVDEIKEFLQGVVIYQKAIHEDDIIDVVEKRLHIDWFSIEDLCK